MKDRFAELLYDLGKVLGIALIPDSRNACKIAIRGQLSLQMQMERSDEELFVLVSLPELPPGRYRQEVLKEALKENLVAKGTLAFLAPQNRLVLFQHFNLLNTTAETLAAALFSLHERALAWASAIQEGRTAPLHAAK